VKRFIPQCFYIQVGFKTVRLPAEGVAPDFDVHQSQRFDIGIGNRFGKQNHSGAGAHHGESIQSQFAERLDKAVVVCQIEHGGAFATGNNKPVQTFQFVGLTYLCGFNPEPVQNMCMFYESPLQG
jgi:hypothetical protein